MRVSSPLQSAADLLRKDRTRQVASITPWMAADYRGDQTRRSINRSKRRRSICHRDTPYRSRIPDVMIIRTITVRSLTDPMGAWRARPIWSFTIRTVNRSQIFSRPKISRSIGSSLRTGSTTTTKCILIEAICRDGAVGSLMCRQTSCIWILMPHEATVHSAGSVA